MPPSLLVRGIRVPAFLYGTAWKEDRTSELTSLALSAGFRGIDTANQRKHYFEAAVGAALSAALSSGAVSRGELFLQTKFTYARGQDHRLPYDPAAPFPAQVEQSFALSLEHLGVTHLDSLILHGPATGEGWNDADRQVWRTMESLHERGAVALLGVSNISAEQLRVLAATARIQPAFVQNRCYARTGWDREVRQLCRELDITYQGFSLLTANRSELAAAPVQALALRRKLDVSQLVFAFARTIGMLPLTGTSSRVHMEQDLHALELTLSSDEVAVLEQLG
jgi:diketogulonate reductase-like aldo/keto reductase